MRRALVLLAAVMVLLAAGCTDDDEPDTTTTVAPGAPTTESPTTSAPDGTAPDTTGAAPGPGEPCEPGTVDCVEDAWGDGEARLIVGYDECAASIGAGGSCDDLDQDGYSGYPDSG